MNFRRQIFYMEGDDIQPSNLPKSRVEEFAMSAAKLAQFDVGDDPAELVRRLGGRIHLQSLDDWVSEDGSIFVHAEEDFDIGLPHYTSPRRDKFTVAHELGHYFLHSNQGETPIVAYRKGTGRLEWEANWFAAALLMPREIFIHAAQTMDEYELANKFGVSPDAARVRKESLGV